MHDSSLLLLVSLLAIAGFSLIQSGNLQAAVAGMAEAFTPEAKPKLSLFNEDNSEGGEGNSGEGNSGGSSGGGEEDPLNSGTMEDRLAAYESALGDERKKSALLASEAATEKARADKASTAAEDSDKKATQAAADLEKMKAERDNAVTERDEAKAEAKKEKESTPGKVAEGLSQLGVPDVPADSAQENSQGEQKPDVKGKEGRRRSEAALKAKLDARGIK